MRRRGRRGRRRFNTGVLGKRRHGRRIRSYHASRGGVRL
jgi:hypothetical protein